MVMLLDIIYQKARNAFLIGPHTFLLHQGYQGREDFWQCVQQCKVSGGSSYAALPQDGAIGVTVETPELTAARIPRQHIGAICSPLASKSPL